MSMLIVVLTAVIGLPGLILGALTVRDWNPIYDPEYLRDTVQQGVVAFLKLGLLLLLLCLGAVAIVGGLAADRDGVPLRFGLWFSAVATWLMAGGFIIHWVRSRRRAAERTRLQKLKASEPAR